MGSRRQCDRRCRRGFTLIELLVVIAIISLLASVLQPSLRRAEASARLDMCKSRMHQQVQAARMYAASCRDYKPPMVANNGTSVWHNWSSTMTRVKDRPVGSGILVELGYMDFTLVLCPAIAIFDDSARDRDMWRNKTHAGSSDVYFWRHPDSVDLSAGPTGDAKEQAVMLGATFTRAAAAGRGGMVMDFNAQGESRYTGVYDGPRWASHPKLGRVNVSYLDGGVRDFDNEELWLPEPGTSVEEVAMWDQAHKRR